MGSATENQKANMQILCVIKAKSFGLRKVMMSEWNHSILMFIFF